MLCYADYAHLHRTLCIAVGSSPTTTGQGPYCLRLRWDYTIKQVARPTEVKRQFVSRWVGFGWHVVRLPAERPQWYHPQVPATIWQTTRIHTRAGSGEGGVMTILRTCICDAMALTVLIPLAILFLRVLRVAEWRDLRAASWIAAGAWILVAIVWLVGIR